ncbi:ArgE/DapE family deacylase [Chloroflexi bacterium TSY]|nr:ArgE/DapE family deacylase [Chloroflexi bacterium TSY]
MELSIDRDYLLDTLTNLVQIDSTNPSLSPTGAGEAEIGAYVANSLDELGLDVTTHVHEPGRVSVVGILPGSSKGRSLMLNAHYDTVDVQGMDEPFSATIRDGRLYGRGAQDMKASLAASMAAVKAICDADIQPAGDLLIAAVADEEYASIGTAGILEQWQKDGYRVDGAIVTEPTDLELCRAHKGFIWLEVETIGRAAHGSRFLDGIDANMRMGRFLAELDKLEQELRGREGHPLTGPPSLHAATLHGGKELSVYADRCVLQIERRTIPGETEEQVVAELQSIIDQLSASDSTFQATIKSLLVRDSFVVEPDSLIVQTLESSATQILGHKPPHVGHTPWMDAALLSAAGVDTVVMGPTGAGLHSVEEWVELNSVYQLAQILAQTALDYCQVRS